MRPILLVALLTTIPAIAGELNGYYVSASSLGPTWRELCISASNKKNSVNVEIFTTYCPSVECMNARMDGVSFTVPASSKILSYVQGDCRIKARFRNGRAYVTQVGENCGDDQRRLRAEGVYERRDTRVQEGDCSPLTHKRDLAP